MMAFKEKLLLFELRLDSSHLAKVHVDVLSGLLVQLRAADLFSKVGDTDGVAGVQLLNKEITTGLDHAVYLVHDGAVHHVNHTLLPYRDAGRVGELDQSVHDLKERGRKKRKEGIKRRNEKMIHTRIWGEEEKK